MRSDSSAVSPANQVGPVRRLGRALVALVFVASASFAWFAHAASPTDARVAEDLLTGVSRDAHHAIAQEAEKHAREALVRAAKLRSGGDEAHARLFDSAAREWAETAHDLIRAAGDEEKAASMRALAEDAGKNAERERALLEETVAENGRRRAQIEQIERRVREAPVRTSKAVNLKDFNLKEPAQKQKEAEPSGRADGGAS